MNFNTTFVSAFVINVNKRENRDINKYIEQGIKLLNVPIPKIIFMEPELISRLHPILPKFNFIIPYSLKDIYLYKFINNLKNDVVSDNSKKDTLEYFMVQCNKTEWVRKAIELNVFNSEQFIWLDFGIFQFYEKLNLSNEEKSKEFSIDIILTFLKSYDKVRIPTIWNINDQTFINYLNIKKITWYFAGSLFGGHKEKLIIFADKMKDFCLNLVENEQTLYWEVNIWYFIYHNNKDIFDLYYGNHDTSIFKNY